MNGSILINNAATADADYIGWSPAQCTIAVTDPGGAASVDILLRNINTASGGQVVFSEAMENAPSDELVMTVPADGSPVPIFIAGKFGFPSTNDKDAGIEVVESQTGNVIFSKQLMVRIRKNANTLSTDERDRFINAFTALNRNGVFQIFRNMHLFLTVDEAHGFMGFLPWHRAYLLDIEREMQAIDPSVALPYWRFDEVAANVFTPDFMGVPNEVGRVVFSSSNQFNFWETDGVPGITRAPLFDVMTESSFGINEEDTLNISTRYDRFCGDMEGDPHGSAHVSFSGLIRNLNTAARDPLFFLLHNNVDRLWAKWQWINERLDPALKDSYPFQGAAGEQGATRVGHNRQDTMWPWNLVHTAPRPNFNPPPGGTFASFQFQMAPTASPVVGEMIDYQGKHGMANRLGFDYDDVPFEI